jgi:hypothetical protein
MQIEDFCERYPKLMHMAHADAWASICQLGLMSTQKIVEHLKLSPTDCERILAIHRAKPETFGQFVIRDQKPMSVAMLEKCLYSDTTPTHWLTLLNSKVFFWPRARRVSHGDRLLRFLETYRGQPQLVLELNSVRFMNTYADRTSVCHINSGATRSICHKRGHRSFVPLAQYEWSRSNQIAEVTVPHQVANVQQFADHASIIHPDGRETHIFQRSG